MFFESTRDGQAAFQALKSKLLHRLEGAAIGGEVRERNIGTIGTALAVAVPRNAFAMPDAMLAERLARQFAAMLDAVRDIIDGSGAEAGPGPDWSPEEQDAREAVLRVVKARRGQPAFRGRLLTLYQERCAITGCDLVEALEAAHIRPHHGEHTDHEANGLLLRADLHTLFDCGMMAIDPDSLRVVVAHSAKNSTYAALHGSKLRVRTQGEPSIEALRLNFEWFKAKHNL